jgi:hypothetical protein
MQPLLPTLYAIFIIGLITWFAAAGVDQHLDIVALSKQYESRGPGSQVRSWPSLRSRLVRFGNAD